MTFIQARIRETAEMITGWGLPAELATDFLRGLTRFMAAYLLLTALIWIWRAVKREKPRVTALEKAGEALAAIFLTAAVLLPLIAARHWEAIRTTIQTSDYWLSNGNWWLDLQQKGAGVITVLFMAALYISLVIVTGKAILSPVRQELKAYGPVWGTVLAVYDFCTGPFWAGLALLAAAYIRTFL